MKTILKPKLPELPNVHENKQRWLVAKTFCPRRWPRLEALAGKRQRQTLSTSKRFPKSLAKCNGCVVDCGQFEAFLYSQIIKALYDLETPSR